MAYSKVRCPTKLKGTFAMHVSSPMVEKNHRRTWRIHPGRKPTNLFHVPPKVVGMSCLFIGLCVARYHFTFVEAGSAAMAPQVLIPEAHDPISKLGRSAATITALRAMDQ